MSDDVKQATEMAAATAKIAHGGVEHGDNDPDATRALLVDKAIRDRAFPPVGETVAGQAMCTGWDSHVRPGDHRDPHRRPADISARRSPGKPPTVRHDVAAVTD